MRFFYQSSLLMLICTFLLGCKDQGQSVLFFDRSSIDNICVFERSLGATIDTFDKDISAAFKPEVLKHCKAAKMLRCVRTGRDLPMINRYYFDSNGQLIFTHYEWSQSVPGISYETRESLMVQELNQFRKYANKQDQLAVQLRGTMGDPVENDESLLKNKTSLLDFFSHKMKFYREGRTVDLCLIWSPKRGARFFKVFAKVYWDN